MWQVVLASAIVGSVYVYIAVHLLTKPDNNEETCDTKDNDKADANNEEALQKMRRFFSRSPYAPISPVTSSPSKDEETVREDTKALQKMRRFFSRSPYAPISPSTPLFSPSTAVASGPARPIRLERKAKKTLFYLKRTRTTRINISAKRDTKAPLRAPKWYPRKAGVTFGFGGKLEGGEEPTKESNSVEGITDSSFDDGVQRALVVGDYKGAVAQCIAANKMADALVIAQVGGTSLWESTRDPYLKVVAAMVNNDLVSLVKTRPLKSWKETLALLCTFAQGDDWTLLCDALLRASGNILAATLCCICSGNIDRTVEIWSKNVTTEHEGRTYVELFQDLMEKTVILALATGQKRFSASLCKLVEKYVEILASQGLLTTAMEYLRLMGSDNLSPELVILRDRIALSSEPEEEVSGSINSGNSRLPETPSYGVNETYSGAGPSGNYYQDGSSYRQNYQQTPGPTYGTQYQQQQPSSFVPQQPTTFVPQQQPNTFVPQQQPTTFIPAPSDQGPPAGFTSQPPTQPAPKGFVPTTPPIIRNVDQYQQPPSLGSQLYPSQVNTISNYQVGPSVSGSLGPVQSPMVPTHGQKISQDAGPTPQPRGFMPINNTGLQRSTSGQAQPPSPSPPAAPPAPPPTVQTADVSNVPAHQKPVISTLVRLFTETSEVMGGLHAAPTKKREIDDNSKKLGALFVKLNNGDISQNASEKLVQLCQALDRGDFPTALQIQIALTTSDWDECSFWLAPLKRMIKVRQTVR